MFNFLDPSLIWTSILFAAVIGLFYVYITWDYDYWKKRGIPFRKPIFPFGNFSSLVMMKESMTDFYRRSYDEFKGHRYSGLLSLGEPTLLVRDPELIKSIFVRDFSNFHDRGLIYDEERDPMSGNLFNLPGKRWHSLRNKLSPTFTSGKMKYMFPVVRQCAEQLQQTVERESEMSGNELECKDLLARYTTDIIGSAAFGVEVGSLKNPNTEFRVIGRRIFDLNVKNALRNAVVIMAPTVAQKFGIQSSDPVASDFFSKIVKETVNYREINNVKRPDFLQLLIGLKDEVSADDETKLTLNQLTAQCFVFFLGGFETSATTLSFCLYELSRNLDVQERLREEIDEKLQEHGGQITYEGLAEMHYMDKVISETLRKYPAVPVLFRECTLRYTIPPSDQTSPSGLEWKPDTRNGGHVIEVGTKVHVPIAGLHYDPQFFPDPERFDPLRFSEDAKKERPSFAYLPFGEGPRVCIGMRFGNMQTKAGLTAVLSKFKVRPSTKTPSPLVFDKKSFVPTVKKGLWLKVLKRKSQ